MLSSRFIQSNYLFYYAYLRRLALLLFLILTSITYSTWADYVEIDAQMSHKGLIKGQKNTMYLKVALKGLKAPTADNRTPLNVALVIDRSGSMRGDRIKRAKEAAIMAVNLLNTDDILSIIAYDNRAEVLVPATKVSNKQRIISGIENIRVNGSTALHAGVTLGGEEVKKFLDSNHVNRVILLSDGIANVGPSSPHQLAQLGLALGGQQISVSTIGLGLGYNEDLMTQLAASSDGNHIFVEHAQQLSQTMEMEFADALSVVAQNVVVNIQCADYVRPVKVYGRTANFKENQVSSKLNQLIGSHEKFILLEVEVDAQAIKTPFNIASVTVDYYDAIDQKKHQVISQATIQHSVKNTSEFEDYAVRSVMEDVISLIANEKQKMAVHLRDEGQSDEAYKIIQKNVLYLEKNAARYKSKRLQSQGKRSSKSAQSIKKKGKEWKRLRKDMKRQSYQFDSQQSY
jgi:Ca-activated chloride channel homolog